MDFWHDNWMGARALCHRVDIFHEHAVSDFVDRALWNLRMLNQVLEPELVRQIVKVSPPAALGADRMVWALTTDGAFSVASVYSLVAPASSCSWVTSQAWLKGCPLKIAFLISSRKS